MKFIDITTFYSTGRGGITTYLERKSQLATSMSPQRHLAHRLILGGAADETGTFHGSKCYWIKSPKVGFNPHYRYLINYFKIARRLDRSQPDIVETSDPYWIPLYLLFWRWVNRTFHRSRVRTRLFLFYRVDFPDTYVLPFFRRFLPPLAPLANFVCWGFLRLVMNRFDGILAHSEIMQAKLQRNGIVAPIFPVGNLTNFTPFTQAQPYPQLRDQVTARFPDCKSLVFYCGRFSFEKGIDTLLSAFAKVRNDANRPVLVMIGSGPWRERLEKIALDPDQRLFLLEASSDRAYLASLYATVDCMVIPGFFETFSQVALESVVAGLPFVAVRGTGGVAALAKPGVAYLCEQTAAELLAAEMAENIRLALAPKSTWYQEPVRQQLIAHYQPEAVFLRLLDAYGSTFQRIFPQPAPQDKAWFEPLKETQK